MHCADSRLNPAQSQREGGGEQGRTVDKIELCVFDQGNARQVNGNVLEVNIDVRVACSSQRIGSTIRIAWGLAIVYYTNDRGSRSKGQLPP